jgi:hypothetical protein
MSLNRGESWTRFGTGLPTVPVHDLVIHPRDGDLIAGTHGRGAWIADNITPLQELTLDVMAEDVSLLDVRPETKWLTTYEFSWTTDKRFYAPNAPTGSTIAYYLGAGAPGQIELEVVDVEGTVVRTLDASTDPGLNTVFWNFSRNPPPDAQGGGRGGRGGGRGGRGGGGGTVAPGE